MENSLDSKLWGLFSFIYYSFEKSHTRQTSCFDIFTTILWLKTLKITSKLYIETWSIWLDPH